MAKLFRLSALLFLIGILSNAPVWGQKVTGKVFDNNNKEPLVGASVFWLGTNIGTITDANGYFEITKIQTSQTLGFRYLGFRDTTVVVTEKKQRINMGMQNSSSQLAEVVIEYNLEAATEKLKEVQMGVDKISMAEAKQLPAIFGEVDIIKVLQLKPGIKSGGEGTAGFFVRGGSADQNLILVQHAPVYNPNHLFGFFSVFNSDAIKDVTIYKSGFPARYGGRLSSVLDVEMQRASPDSFFITGGLGLISSRGTINVPLIKNKAAIMVSARRTYVDLITEGINNLAEGRKGFQRIPRYFFYDFNGSITYDINAKNKLNFSAYYGNDIFTFNGQNFGSSINWGNRSYTLEWNHQLNSKLSVTNALFNAGYVYLINNQFAGTSLSLGSGINDYGFVSNWNYFISDKHKLKFGANSIYHRFSVGDFGLKSDFTDIEQGEVLFGLESGAYALHEWRAGAKTAIQTGLRLSHFVSKQQHYYNLEPRLAVKQDITEKIALKMSYARMSQYLHLVTSSGASLPTDLWYPSNDVVAPQLSDQVSLGLHKAFLDDKLFASLEGYYKWIHNAIDFKDGANLFANPNLSQEFVFGKGWAYGAEAYVEKKNGKTTGWIGYTLAWTWRQFEDINNGLAFHPRFDRRHDISVVVIHQLNKRISLSGTWVYGTGNFVTLAGGRFTFQDISPREARAIPHFTSRNDFQMPPTHRLDLGMVYKLKPKRGESDLTFSLYNAYSRRNPFYIFYNEIRNDDDILTGFEPNLVSLFPILPAITYNFRF